MEQYVKRTQRDYSMSFKLSVVRQIERGEMTYIEAHQALRHPKQLNCTHVVTQTQHHGLVYAWNSIH